MSTGEQNEIEKTQTTKGIENMIDYSSEALANAMALSSNPYPGRGIILGMDQTGTKAIQIYWIMGRSKGSQNRVLTADGGLVFTEPANRREIVGDPKLTIYNAMNGLLPHWYVVSNGSQTDSIISAIERTLAYDPLAILINHEFEPDAPNYTSRIVGVYSSDLDLGPRFSFSILRKSRTTADCERFCFQYDHIPSGYGLCITTYSGDGNPLPPFTGEPYLLALDGDIDAVAANCWLLLNPDNRVALVVKFIDIKTGEYEVKIINKFTRVAA